MESAKEVMWIEARARGYLGFDEWGGRGWVGRTDHRAPPLTASSTTWTARSP